MIVLHKLNGKEIVINAELIEAIEATPDTVVTLVTGNRYIVTDNVDVVIQKVVEFKGRITGDFGRPKQDWMNLKK